jgi:hypothetical protein
MAAAASSPQSQAQDLVATVAVFKLNKGDAAQAPTPRPPTPARVQAPAPRKIAAPAKPAAPRPVQRTLPQPVRKAAPPAKGGGDEWETF